jgi:hypothetical protein
MKSFAIALLFVTVSAGCLVAGTTNKTLTPGTDDLSRYVDRKAKPGGQTLLLVRAHPVRRPQRGQDDSTTAADEPPGVRQSRVTVRFFRDASGRTLWTATPSSSQTTTYRDASGRMLSTASTTGVGIIFRDAGGLTDRHRATLRNGSATMRDANGAQWGHYEHGRKAITAAARRINRRRVRSV